MLEIGPDDLFSRADRVELFQHIGPYVQYGARLMP